MRRFTEVCIPSVSFASAGAGGVVVGHKPVEEIQIHTSSVSEIAIAPKRPKQIRRISAISAQKTAKPKRMTRTAA